MSKEYAISGLHGFIGGNIAHHLENSGNTITYMGRDRFYDPKVSVFIDAGSYGNMFDQKDISEIYRANTWRVIENILTHEDSDYDAYICFSSGAVSLPKKTFYTLSKIAIEQFVDLYTTENKKPVVTVRPYSITGVGEQVSHLIPKLIESCFLGTRMPFVASPVHDFLDIDDFVKAIDVVEANARLHPGHVFSVGSGIQYSNKDVLDIVEDVTGRKANVEYVENLRPYDSKEWQADVSLMQSLGWTSQKTLKQSIIEMVEAYGS